jgi:hypothetical protein
MKLAPKWKEVIQLDRTLTDSYYIVLLKSKSISRSQSHEAIKILMSNNY